MEAVVEEISTYELERGKPMPDTIHAAVQINLAVELVTRYRQQYRILSELALATVPSGTTPDLAVYPAFSLDFENRSARNPTPPLLCIEIQSPSQSAEEMVDKTEVYFQFGVKSCWLVMPAIRAVLVYDRPGHYAFFHADDTLRDETLGLELPLGLVFA